MEALLTPIKTESLKDVFVLRFEELILSGKFGIGQKLPSERELALQLGVSRPVVHEGLVELSSRGLVTLTPPRGHGDQRLSPGRIAHVAYLSHPVSKKRVRTRAA